MVFFNHRVLITTILLLERGYGQNLFGYYHVEEDDKEHFVVSSSSHGGATVSPLSSSSSSSSPSCESREWPKYHVDSACDRLVHNKYRESLDRPGAYRRLTSMPTKNNNVPNEKTEFCPVNVEDFGASFMHHEEDTVNGFDTVWLLENKASTPVVVYWVKNGVEYHAHDPSIVPPNIDPKSVLQPGQWMNFLAYESHIFHVRSLSEDNKLGPILLQHRVGLIPITNKYGPSNLSCSIPGAAVAAGAGIESDINDLNRASTDNKIDVDELQRKLAKLLSKAVNQKKSDVEVKKAIAKMDPEPIHPEKNGERHPDYARTVKKPHPQGRPCNAVDIGFRNEVGCPIHAYYSGMQGANSDTGVANCDEKFKFHLGLDSFANDFMFDWESKTKYESSFIGHTFVFRLASDTSVLLDQVTLQPTYVTDCPNLKIKEQVQKSTATKVPIELMQQQKQSNGDDVGNEDNKYNVKARTLDIKNLLFSSLKGFNSTDIRGTSL